MLDSWEVSDQKVRKCLPEQGWIAQAIEYLDEFTDAPLIFDLGSLLTGLCTCASRANIKVLDHDGSGIDLPLVMWSMLIGPSGSRKSTPAKRVAQWVRRATTTTPGWKSALLPKDGTVEGWTKALADENAGLMYRSEFSSVLDQARRSYNSGLVSWLLELWECDDYYERRLASQDSVSVERPRLSILGPIPPRTFREKLSKSHWSSGFLPRMLFFCGDRQYRQRVQHADAHEEARLAAWLGDVACRTRGTIVIHPRELDTIDQWVEVEVEPRRKMIHDDAFSHLQRYQEATYRIASLYAVSRLKNPQTDENNTIEVSEDDVAKAIQLARILLRSSLELFSFSVSSEAISKDVEEAILSKLPKPDEGVGMPAKDLKKAIEPMVGECGRRLFNLSIQNLMAINEIEKISLKKSGRGRPSIVYRLAT